ncbi:hypothetical protein PG993_004340 [Apiospora rasikravindrae]|uniref:N-acetyltransferase domain-containing protein n=1 Tax=Apiospora rasikravindrae TaxID=990691 RepID=A0ABR1TE92_9PEZI
MANPSPRFYLEPLSEEKHALGVYDIWCDPANLVGTGMEKAPTLEEARAMIRERAYGAKPGIVNFAIMVGPESPLYGLVAAPAPNNDDSPPQQQGQLALELERETTPPKLIGITGVLRVAPEEAGWFVAGPCRGLGVAAEAVGLMLGKYWDTKPAAAEVIAYIQEGNVASETVAAKVGFVRAMGRTLVKGSTLPNGLVAMGDCGCWVVKRPT